MIHERDKPRLALEAGFPKFVKLFVSDADKFVTNMLEPIADAYALLRDSKRVEQQFGIEAAKAVRSLGRIDNKDWLPPALLRLWKREPGSNGVVAEFLVQLERLAYFLFVTRRGINDRIGRFARVMDEFDPRDGQGDESEGLVLTQAEQAEFIAALDGPLYPKSRVCKAVLQRLDEALSSGGASYDNLISIEHVLPQTVEENSEWASLFSDQTTRDEWTHRLANLVFLTHRINIRASNWGFEKKKREYFGSAEGASPFVITQGVLKTEEWTPGHLAERQDIMLRKLATIWYLNVFEKGFQEGAGNAWEPQLRGAAEPTDEGAIKKKRAETMDAFGGREGVILVRKGAKCWSEDGGVRAVCAVSKRYPSSRPPYWYGYSVPWRQFLSEGKQAFIILACLDRDSAYAVPNSEIEAVLAELYATADRHWHIVLDENERGDPELCIPNGARISLKKYQLQLGVA
jgi:uncharacterized protein DUF1524